MSFGVHVARGHIARTPAHTSIHRNVLMHKNVYNGKFCILQGKWC